MTSDDLFDRSIADLAGSIRSRAISPVELTEAMLDRIATRDAELHAYVTVTADRARADARRAEEEIGAGRYRGALHGVPIALKDLVDTAGIETAAGTKAMAGRVPDRDATVAARLADAGTVLLGKLAMTEGAFAEHRPERPEPRNPWSRDHWTGASSSGSAVAVAGGLAFAALGSDTGGSIRFPCSACGVTGLKPGWGRVSRHGIFPFAPSLDHVGPIARNAADCAIVLAAIAGPDPRDPTSRAEPLEFDDRADLRGLRVGIDAGQLGTIDPAVAAVVEQACAVLAARGAELVEIALPPLEPLAAGWAAICGVEVAIAHAGLFDTAPDDYGPALRALIELGRTVPARAYAELHLARLDFAGAMARLHEQADLVALPVLPMPTPRLATLAQAGNDPALVSAMMRFTAPFNYSGQPSLTLPGGSDADGLPIGLQLVGPMLGEAVLLRAGRVFQQATDWHRRRPPSTAAAPAPNVVEVV